MFTVGLAVWVSVPSFGLHFQIDASSVPSNTTVVIVDGNVVFAKISLQNIPTIINGITTSTSIIVAFSGVVIGFMRGLFQSDKKAKTAFFTVLFAFAYIFMYLFGVYTFLATGGVDLALRWSLGGLLLSLLIFILAMLSGYYRMGMLEERESEKMEPEETEQEKLKREFQNRSIQP